MMNLGGYDQVGYQDTSNLSMMEKMKLMIMMRKMRDHQENMDKFRKSQDFDDESLESVWSQMVSVSVCTELILMNLFLFSCKEIHQRCGRFCCPQRPTGGQVGGDDGGTRQQGQQHDLRAEGAQRHRPVQQH